MIAVADLHFRYPQGGFTLGIPRLDVPAGQSVAVVGPSGSGKTTLLHLLAGVLVPNSGTITIAQTELASLSEPERRRFRLHRVGMVFQQFGLIEYLEAGQNVRVALQLMNAWTPEHETRARTLAAALGLSQKWHEPIGRLSQGEKQRVAVLRALVHAPPVILADEPTGNLDPETKQRVLDAFLQLAREQGNTVLTVTHDHGLLTRFDRVIDFMTFRQPGAL
jgi:putative ABC transport system ATP-binding protein